MRPDLTATHAALANACGARAAYRRRPAHDPERRHAIQVALGALRDAWGAEHEDYMRRGRQLGRRVSDDPVRVAARDRRAELKRLRSMLDPTSGTPRPEGQTWTAAQMEGKLHQSLGVMKGIAEDFGAARRVLGRGSAAARKGGGVYTSMHELNAEARRLLDVLRAERRDLRTAWQRFGRTPVMGYQASDDFDELADRLSGLREYADLLTVELTAAARLRTPDARPARVTWTANAIREALSDYQHEHGRLPTKAELNADPGLPHYTICRRKLGRSPLSSLG